MMVRVKVRFVVLLVTLLAGSVSAARFLEEQFNYPENTQLNGQTATALGLSNVWGGWRSPSEIITSNGSVAYGLLITANRQLVMDYSAYGNGDNVRCWFDPSVQTKINQIGSTYWYSVVFRTPPTFQPKKSYKVRFDRGDYYDMYGLHMSNGYIMAYVGTTFSAPRAVQPNTNVLAVFSVTKNASANYSIEAWFYDDQVVPSSEPSPGTGYSVTGTTPSGSDVQKLYFYVDTPGGSGTKNPASVDEVRGGDTFSDVAPVPEPGVAAAVALAAGLMAVRKRE